MDELTECPLCHSEEIHKGWKTAGRQSYHCRGCSLHWAEPKNHIVDTSKKADHFVDTTETISNKKIIELAKAESKKKYDFSWEPEIQEKAFLDGVKFCLKINKK